MKILIPDASCIIALSSISKLELLAGLSDNVILAEEVAREVASHRASFSTLLPSSASITKVLNLPPKLDLGETQTIALGLETTESIVILDEIRGRKKAARLKVPHTGTLMLLIQAEKRGLIAGAASAINEVISKGFRIAPKTLGIILQTAKEA